MTFCSCLAIICTLHDVLPAKNLLGVHLRGLDEHNVNKIEVHIFLGPKPGTESSNNLSPLKTELVK